MNKSVLVTGGAGFIGHHVVGKLLENGWRVVAIDDFNDSYSPDRKRKNISVFMENRNFRLETGDISDREFVMKAVGINKPAFCIHLAARSGVRPSFKEPLAYVRTNVLGTMNILEAAKHYPVENFLYASSSSVYGNRGKTPFSESDAADDQISPYALTKKAGELVCKTYSDLARIPVTCLRIFTVYGPGQRPDLAIHRFMARIMAGRPVEIFGDGNSTRDYTFVDDIVDGIVRSLEKPFPFETINLGNSNPVTLKDLVGLIEKTLGRKAKTVKKPRQPGDVEHTYADIRLARRLLGWEPKTGIEKGLGIMADWVKEGLND